MPGWCFLEKNCRGGNSQPWESFFTVSNVPLQPFSEPLSQLVPSRSPIGLPSARCACRLSAQVWEPWWRVAPRALLSPTVEADCGIHVSEGTHDGIVSLIPQSSPSMPHLTGCSPAPVPGLSLVSPSTPTAFTLTSPEKLSPALGLPHNHVTQNLSKAERVLHLPHPPGYPACSAPARPASVSDGVIPYSLFQPGHPGDILHTSFSLTPALSPSPRPASCPPVSAWVRLSPAPLPTCSSGLLWHPLVLSQPSFLLDPPS